MAFYKCARIYVTENSNTEINTASGPIANFNTLLATPLLSLKANFKATQEAGTPTPDSPKAISGVSEVSVYHCHKNLYQYDESKILVGTTTAQQQRAYFDLGFTNCTLSFSGSYKSGETPNNRRINVGRLANGQLSAISSYIAENTVTPCTVKYGANERAVLIITVDNTEALKTELQLLDLQIELGSTATDFEPYNGSTTLINLGGTYYGGYVEQDKDGKRELVVTHSDSVDLNTLTFYRATFSGNNGFYADLPNGLIKGTGSATIDGLCTNYKVTSQASMPEDKSCRFYSHTDWGGFSRIAIRDDDTIDMTGEEFTAYVTGQICYEIQNPQTIALPDGEPIKSFAGINNIYADTGDSAVEYRNLAQGEVNNG